MKQIKRLTLSFLITFMVISTWGAKAISTPIQVLQTDGTTLGQKNVFSIRHEKQATDPDLNRN